MRLLAIFLAFVVLALPHRAEAQAKFALIIANSDYDGDGKVDATENGVRLAHERGFVGDLANPWFDSVRVGQALKSAGFEVETFYNANNAMLSGAVARLRARAQAAGPDTATVFYYAGHGVQIGGQTFLVGANTQITGVSSKTAEERQKTGFRLGVPLMMLLSGARWPTGNGYELMLIDACRDNPWEARARKQVEAEGGNYAGERAYGALSVPSARVMIGFSTQPGQFAQDGFTAASSPFANAVSQRAAERGLSIDALLQGVTGQVAAMSGAAQIPTVVGRLGDASLAN